MAHPHPKIIFGAAVTLWGIDAEETETHLKLLEELGVKDIDCAEGYGKAEENLGKTNATLRFNVDTKCSVAMGPDFMTKDVVLDHAKESLRKLGTKSVSSSCNALSMDNANRTCIGRYLLSARSRSQSSVRWQSGSHRHSLPSRLL